MSLKEHISLKELLPNMQSIILPIVWFQIMSEAHEYVRVFAFIGFLIVELNYCMLNSYIYFNKKAYALFIYDK